MMHVPNQPVFHFVSMFFWNDATLMLVPILDILTLSAFMYSLGIWEYNY